MLPINNIKRHNVAYILNIRTTMKKVYLITIVIQFDQCKSIDQLQTIADSNGAFLAL